MRKPRSTPIAPRPHRDHGPARMDVEKTAGATRPRVSRCDPAAGFDGRRCGCNWPTSATVIAPMNDCPAMEILRTPDSVRLAGRYDFSPHSSMPRPVAGAYVDEGRVPATWSCSCRRAVVSSCNADESRPWCRPPSGGVPRPGRVAAPTAPRHRADYNLRASRRVMRPRCSTGSTCGHHPRRPGWGRLIGAAGGPARGAVRAGGSG